MRTHSKATWKQNGTIRQSDAEVVPRPVDAFRGQWPRVYSRNDKGTQLPPRVSLHRRKIATGRIGQWAFYNEPGGYVIGQVWADPKKPDATRAKFPDGTVSIKLLFTAALESQVPYLHDGYRWQGNIDPVGYGGCSKADPSGVRTPTDKMTLLQIDLAVRDSRADATTGWVMGTFVYDGNAKGATPWERMVPVGVQWGNDPALTPQKHANGRESVKESWINPKLRCHSTSAWLGRLNGPVDNSESACLSCHGTAQTPDSSPMVPPHNSTDTERMRWFRNVKTDEAFDTGRPEEPIAARLLASARRWNPESTAS